MHAHSGLAWLGLTLVTLTAITPAQVALPNSITIVGQIPHFDYILTILLENQGLNQTYGSHCTGNCTYITLLANTYSLSENYYDIGHPSLPNYLALTNGGNYDTVPFDTDCSPTLSSCQVSAPNLLDSIERSSRTWRAYMEDDTAGGCSHTTTADYANNHNPFLYYPDITGNATRCNNILNANPGASGFLAMPTRLLDDLNSTTTAANYMWLSPNLCDDGHDTCGPLNNTVSQPNEYLSLLVPKILNSTIFRTQRAVLFITWDEATSKTANIVTAIWAGPLTKTSYKSTAAYTHYSTVRTIEFVWNLPTLTSYDSSATPTFEFLNP